MRVTFYGAAGTVTGTKHLLETDSGYRVLLDCGLYQGNHPDEPNRHLGFDPRTVDVVLLSHAHIDHCGLIPKLVKEGFKGKIYCTSPTAELAQIMLEDSARIQENDIQFINKKRFKHGLPPLEPLYTTDDALACARYFVSVEYHQTIHLNDEVSFYFTDAGHIIGSACTHILYKGKKRITFTGDVGRLNDKILKKPETFPTPDVLICESTYGNKNHRPSQDYLLFDIVHETCFRNKGKLIIPAFSVDRTQEIIYALDRLKTEGRLTRLPVYVDSPLSIKATHVMRKYSNYFNPEIKSYMDKTDGDAFHFEHLTYITDRRDSQALNDASGPMIIISASGMAEAGPVKHHIAHAIENPNNTILFAGYCTPESLGGKLLNGNKRVRIFGEFYDVKARIEKLEGYSAHADKNELLQWLSVLNPKQISKVFLVHGESDAALFLQNLLLQQGLNNVSIPQLKQSFNLI